MVGGVLMALFIGTPSYMLLMGLGISNLVAAPVAIILASMGESGYSILITRAKQIIGGGK